MATQVQIRRGTSSQVAAFTGAEGEIVVNTTNDSIHVNDGSSAGGFEMARVDGSNWAITNAISTTANISFGDNDKAIFGGGGDLQIYHDGTDSIINEGAAGNLLVQGATIKLQTANGAKDYLVATPSAEVKIFHNNSEKLATTSTGIDCTGTVTADGGTIVSTGSDAFSSKAVGGYAIQAYQDATSSGHTALDLRSDATTGTRYLIRGYNDAAGTPTEVFSVGADGTVTADGLNLDGDIQGDTGQNMQVSAGAGAGDKLDLRAGDDVRIYVDGATAHKLAANFANNGDVSLYEDTGTTPKLFWDASAESLGINDTTPARKLSVNSAGVQIAAKFESTSTTSARIGLVDANTTADNYVNVAASGNDMALYAGAAERVRIDSSGNLLIGTTNSSIETSSSTEGVNILPNKISVSRNAGATANFNRISNDGDIVKFRRDGSPVGSIGSIASNYLSIGTGDTGLLFQDDNDFIEPCNVGASAGRDAAIDLGHSGGRFKDLYLSGKWVSNGSNNTVRASFQVSGTQYGYINVATTGTLYSTSSDYRIKENVVALTNATERLKQLNPLRFSFIPDHENTIVDGFFAHEVADVVPEAVIGAKDAMRDEEYEVNPAVLDDDGNVITEAVMGTRSVPDYQGIDQSKLVPLLVATIQELEARITQLENN